MHEEESNSYCFFLYQECIADELGKYGIWLCNVVIHVIYILIIFVTEICLRCCDICVCSEWVGYLFWEMCVALGCE